MFINFISGVLIFLSGMILKTIVNFASKPLETELRIGSQSMSQIFLQFSGMNLGLPHQGGVPFQNHFVYLGCLPQKGHVLSVPDRVHQVVIHPQNLTLQPTTLF